MQYQPVRDWVSAVFSSKLELVHVDNHLLPYIDTQIFYPLNVMLVMEYSGEFLST